MTQVYDPEKRLRITRPTVLRDVLHNLSPSENGNEHDFSRGALVGVVSTLMAMGLDFLGALEIVKKHLPSQVARQRVPESWLEFFDTTD